MKPFHDESENNLGSLRDNTAQKRIFNIIDMLSKDDGTGKRFVVIIFNMGLWFNVHRGVLEGTKSTEEMFRPVLQRAMRFFSALFKHFESRMNFLLIWMETSATHFSQSDNGYYAGKESQRPEHQCAPLRNSSVCTITLTHLFS